MCVFFVFVCVCVCFMEIVVVGIKKNNKQNRQDQAWSGDYLYKLRSVKLFNFILIFRMF